MILTSKWLKNPDYKIFDMLVAKLVITALGAHIWTLSLEV